MGKSFRQTDILFWNAGAIQSKKYEFINYLEANNKRMSVISEIHSLPRNLNVRTVSWDGTGHKLNRSY
jgi:hypothetical protein